MSGQLLVSLFSPSIGILFCAAFFGLWLNQRNLNYSLSAALGFLLSSIGFVIQDILPAWPYDLQRFTANLCFLVSICALMVAPLQRREIQPSFRVLAVVVTLTMAALCWYLLVDPDLIARIAIVSVSLTIPVIITIIKLMRATHDRLSDRLVLSALWFTLALFILRPLLAFLVPESFGNYTALEQSTYWGLVHFTYVLMSVTLAIAVALDLMDELRHQATTDTLSGLLNRRGFESAATMALQNSQQAKLPVALMITDIDHFKSVNDSQGHAAGDAVIHSFGHHVKEVAGESAVCGRIGGEEFAILLPGHNETTAVQIAEAIRQGFHSDVTTSIGLVISESLGTLSALLGIADAALYQAKANGRDQVCVLRDGG